MPEMHLHGRPCRLPATTPLTWAGPWPYLLRKLRPVLVAIALSIALLSRTPLRQAMLGLSVHSQWPPSQVLPVLRESNPLPLSLLVAPPFPRHPPDIGFFCQYPGRPAYLEDHTHVFPGIHTVSQPGYAVDVPSSPYWGAGNNATLFCYSLTCWDPLCDCFNTTSTCPHKIILHSNTSSLTHSGHACIWLNNKLLTYWCI